MSHTVTSALDSVYPTPLHIKLVEPQRPRLHTHLNSILVTRPPKKQDLRPAEAPRTHGDPYCKMLLSERRIQQDHYHYWRNHHKTHLRSHLPCRASFEKLAHELNHKFGKLLVDRESREAKAAKLPSCYYANASSWHLTAAIDCRHASRSKAATVTVCEIECITAYERDCTASLDKEEERRID